MHEHEHKLSETGVKFNLVEDIYSFNLGNE